MWKNTVESDRPHIIRLKHIACWITKATDTHSEYVLLIACLRQRCLLERTSVYIACLVSGAFVCSRIAPINFVMSVRLSACISAAPTGKVSPNFYVWTLMKICRETKNFLLKSGKHSWALRTEVLVRCVKTCKTSKFR